MKKMLKMVLRYWPFALLASLFMVAEVFIDLVQPKMMEIIVDNGILGLDRGGVSDVGLIISTGIRMIIIVAFGGLAGILSAVFANVTGQNYGNDLRKACFTRIMHFSFAQTDKFSTGSLITRITNDITQVQQLVMQLIRGLVRCLMFFIGGTSALLSLDLSFGVIVACAFPLIILNVTLVVWKTNPLFNLLQSSLDKLNNIMQENVSGARVVKAFVQENYEQKKFEQANDNLVNTQFKVQIMLSLLRPVMNIVLNLAVVGIIWVGSISVKSGSIAPGTVMAAITYISQILSGMMMLAMIFQTLSRGSVSAKRIAEVLNTDSEIQDGTNSTGPSERGTISFKNVSFSYPGTNTTVLKNISLDIQSGQTLGIIGATGSGKTTLINLIPRFYDVTGGYITVDGIDVKDYKLETLRKKISVCLQKSELFSTTIRDNIAMGKDGATEEEIRAAAQSAQAEEFILQQTGGYDTPVAERGMSLSGGQRQRIAISRALLKQGEILIFDDSTSALDLKTESRLYQALNSNYKGITKIIIAQRIASVKNADKIAVLDGGSICATGTHEELLKTCPVYQDIYDSQLKQTEGGRV